jgi:DNA-binding response OmpR family regulator
MDRTASGVLVADPLGDMCGERPEPDIDPLCRLNAHLTPQERAVFDVLWHRRNRVVSRCEICRQAGLMELSERRCDALIVSLRRTLGSDRIRTVRRRGWMLVA